MLLGSSLFVADSDNHRIVEYAASNLSYVRAFGGKGDGIGQFKEPRGLCTVPCEANDQLMIADTRNHRLIRANVSGEVIASLGGPGTKAGLFREPIGVACTTHAIFVSEEGNRRLQVLSYQGAPMQVISFGRVASPPPIKSLCAGDGYVYVVTGNKVRVFSEELRGIGAA